MISAASSPAFQSSFRLLVASTLAVLLGGCGAGNFGSNIPAATGSQVKLEGFVHGGQQPISGATVQLYTTGTAGDQSPAIPMIFGPHIPPVTDTFGAFSITGLYSCNSITDEVYLIASGGNPAPAMNNPQIVLMTALGPCGNLTSATHIIINEVTTIGSIYPITPFMSSYLNVGAAPANQLTLANDFIQINKFIDTDGGQSPGPALPGGFTAPINNLNALANSMAACVNSPGGVSGDGSPCGNFFLFAKPAAGSAPTNTADAILDIANNPTQNVGSIYLLPTASPVFQPTLSVAPPDWTLKILPNLVLATPSNLVGVGSPTVGTLTLGQAAPAGGLTVNLVSSNTAAVTVTTPANIAAGASSGTFNYIGVASGTSTITGSATGYYGSSVTLSATNSLISLGAIPAVAPGQSVSLPLSLGTPAPAGGVTVNFTSATPGIATVTPSVFIPGGLQIPASNPQVTGVTVGTSSITATATGYAPGARNASVSVTASFPTTFSIPIGVTTNETLTTSAPAPAGGITFNLTVDNPSIFSVPSTVTVAAGATTVNVPINGLATGVTNLRANSTNIPEAVSAVTVNGGITLQTNAITTGKLLENASYFYFAAAPPTPTTATLTSSNPAVFTVSTSPTVAGTTSVNLPAITGTSANSYYIQGIGLGSGTLTISAPGYLNTTVAITVDPSGFAFNGGDFLTTTLSPDYVVQLQSVVLNPVTLAVLFQNNVAPAAGAVAIGVTSGTPATGTILNSPTSFAPGTGIATVNFHSGASGASVLTVSTPAGFSTPAGSQQITATVSAPPVNVQTTTLTSGVGLEVSSYVYLSQTPTVPTTITLTSSNPAVAVISTSTATTVGTGVATFTSVVNGSAVSFYVQGLSVGTSTITVSANPYASATISVTVDPSGFIFQSNSFSTTSFSVPSTLYAQPVILNPSTLAVIGGALVAPQAAPVNVTVTSGTTATGTITSSPIVFTAGSSSLSTNFQPVGAGTSVISLGTPSGFSTPTPANTQQLTATVTAPPISEQTGSLATGVNLQQQTYAFLSQTPPSPVTVTITSSNPAVATISTGSTIAGAASTTFPNTVNSSALSYSVQGQSVGTSTITVSAPGYSSTTMTVTVSPSGFILQSSSFSTTTFSPNSTIYVQPVYLNPATLAVLGGASFNPGIGTIPITITSSAPQVGTITTPINFVAGSSSNYATFSPVAAGTTNLSIATPPGYSTPTPANTQQITATVTAPPISLQTGSLTTGTNMQAATYAYLSQTPPSPVTVTVTSASASVATISTSATVAGGASVSFNGVATSSALSFYVQGHAVGSTTVTIAAAGFSNATLNITVDPSGFIFQSSNFATTTFSGPSDIYVQPVILNPGTLTVLGGGTLAPSAGAVQVSVTSSSGAVGTVTSPVNFAVGDSSDFVVFQPVSAGSTNLSITTPPGFSTPSAAASQQISASVTAPPINVQTASVATGLGLQTATYSYLSQTPPAAVTVTVTSSNPAVAVVSKSQTIGGSGSISFLGVVNSSALSYYVQGVGVGTATITISAPGFTNATVTVAADPSGFVFQSGNFSTTTFSGNSSVYVQPVILSPGVLTVLQGAAIGPGGAVLVPIASSSTSVGTIATPVTFNPGDTSDLVLFNPSSSGSTTLSISTPAGFTTPSQSATQSITATVTAPNINTQVGSLTTGTNLQVTSYVYLGVTPPAAVTVTLTVGNPAIATVANSNTTVGTTTINFGAISSSTALSYFLQGQSPGSTTLTVSAPGYNILVIPITVDPSGFVITSPGNFSTTAAAANTTVTVQPAILSSGVLTVLGYGQLNPGIGTVAVPVGSTSPQIGTVSTSAVNFTAGVGSLNFAFHPIAGGTTNIVVTQPAGFTPPSQPNTYNIVATVN